MCTFETYFQGDHLAKYFGFFGILVKIYFLNKYFEKSHMMFFFEQFWTEINYRGTIWK